MALGSLVVGQRFVQGGSTCRLMRDYGNGKWVVEDLTLGRIAEQTSTELLAKWTKGDLHFSDGTTPAAAPRRVESAALKDAIHESFRQSCSDALWYRAQAKLAFVTRLEHLPMTAGVLAPIIREIWESKTLWKSRPGLQFPPHFTTVASWVREYRASDRDIRALLDRHHAKGNSGTRLPAAVGQIADDVIESLYMTPERPTIKETTAEIRGRIAKLNVGRLLSEKLDAPSMAYVKRRLAEISEYDKYRARYGLRAAGIKFRAAGRGVVAEKPLDRVCMDHSRMDLVVVDDVTGLPLGRPWLTLVIDECSRYVIGYYIGFEEPSGVSVARALRNALMPKETMLQKYPNVVSAWDAWGTGEITTLVVDNGLEFHGDTIEKGAGRFGMIVQFCPRKKPWYKGKIERFFGTLNAGLLNGIPGKTFNSILERGDYEPTKHAVVGLETLREVVLTWIVDVYHQTLHRGLGGVPAEVWRSGIQAVDRWLPVSSLSVDTAFSRVETRRLTHKGIEHDCLFYNSQDLGAVREQYGSEINVEVRVMDDDLGSIIVVIPGGEQLVRVPALDAKYTTGLTRYQHKVCKRFQRRLLDDESREITLFDAKTRIRDLIRMDMGLIKRASRNKQARFNERSAREDQWHPPATHSGREPSMPTAPPPPASAAPVYEALISEDDVPLLASRRVHNLEAHHEA